MHIKIESVQTETCAMEYFRFGHGSKNLVILPGLSVQSVMGAADAVAAAYQSLEDRFTIYVFDRRRDLPPVYLVRDMAHDTALAFQALGLQNVCLFGASQGGMIALVIAIEHPELVERMALGSASAHVQEAQFRANYPHQLIPPPECLDGTEEEKVQIMPFGHVHGFVGENCRMLLQVFSADEDGFSE